MKTLVLLSGGIDSAVVLAKEVAAGRKPPCLFVHYGQRHAVREYGAATRIARSYGCELWPLYLSPEVMGGGSALTGSGEIPTGLPPDHPDQAATVVPNRNMVLLSVAAAVAVRRDCDTVLFGANAGDAAVYRDCREAFVGMLSAAMKLSCGVGVVAPLVRRSKAEVVKRGRELGVPLELTWSCYTGGEEPCGECGACRARREAGA